MTRRTSAIMVRALATALAIGAATIEPALAEPSAFVRLHGNWRGNGELQLEGGKSEQLRCTAYYTQRDKKAEELGLAIRCASTSYTIELRSQLSLTGSQISGTWEERTFNASGNVSGKVEGSDIKLQVVGGGFTASMAVATAGGSQTVLIRTQGNQLQGVSIRLAKG